MKDDEISHDGIITSITKDVITVAVKSTSACGACSAKSICGMSENKFKNIDILTNNGGENNTAINPDDYILGQKVEVYMKSKSGTKAIIYGYFYPLIVLLTALIIMLIFVKIEWLSALVSLAAVGLYYLALKLFFNNKIKRDFTFHIRAIKN